MIFSRALPEPRSMAVEPRRVYPSLPAGIIFKDSTAGLPVVDGLLALFVDVRRTLRYETTKKGKGSESWKSTFLSPVAPNFHPTHPGDLRSWPHCLRTVTSFVEMTRAQVLIRTPTARGFIGRSCSCNHKQVKAIGSCVGNMMKVVPVASKHLNSRSGSARARDMYIEGILVHSL